MSTRTQKEAAGPLGVIGCLTAGFEVIGRHLWLTALPVLLDLLLWLGPRLSVAPVLRQLFALLMAQPVLDPTTARQVAQAAQLLEQFGKRFNLLSLLSMLPLLDVPTLLSRHAPGTVAPLGSPGVLSVTSVLALMAWVAGLVLAGLALGSLYLDGLAHWVRAENSHTPTSPHFPGVGELIRVFLFAAGLLMVGIMLVPLWTLLVGAVLAIAPPLGLLVWSLGIGLGSYIALHLLFVVPGILLGGRGLLQAILESILLIHTQFPSVVGLILLVVVIYEGLGFVWSLPSGDSWSLVVGILGNGCIATGLMAAIFVFYQERIGQLIEMRQAPAKT